jgi:hypothetical protein
VNAWGTNADPAGELRENLNQKGSVRFKQDAEINKEFQNPCGRSIFSLKMPVCSSLGIFNLLILLRKTVVPGGGFEPPTRGFSIRYVTLISLINMALRENYGRKINGSLRPSKCACQHFLTKYVDSLGVFLIDSDDDARRPEP